MSGKPFHEGRISLDIAECHRIDIISVIFSLGHDLFNLYIFYYFKIWIFFNEGERNYKSLSIYNKNHLRLVYDTKWKGGYAKNKEENDKNVSYSFSDGIAVSSLKWAPPGIVA